MTYNNTVPTNERDVRIGDTIFHVTSIYSGKITLEKTLHDWAITKIIDAQKCHNTAQNCH